MTNAVTLSPAQPHPTLSGTIDGYGVIGVFTISQWGTATTETLAAAVYGPAGTNFSIVNTGQIEAPFPTNNVVNDGIVLATTGSVRNAGIITGGDGGIALLGTAISGYVANTGTIAGDMGYGVFAQAPAVVTNFDTGTIAGHDAAIDLAGGGFAYNFGGTLLGYTGIITGGAALHIINTGLIETTGIFGDGIVMGYGGTIDNEAGGTIISNTGLFLTGGTAINAGLIKGINGPRGENNGVILTGTLINQASGTITAGTGVQFIGSGILYNAGLILGGLENAGVEINTYERPGNAQDTIINTGTISGVFINGQPGLESVINNQKGGLIAGGIYTLRGPLDLINDGLITGATAVSGYGDIQNNGMISASGAGIVITHGGTILDTGRIIGAGGTAISFSKGHANILELTPTATIIGAIDLNGTLNLEADAKTGTLNAAALQNVKAFTIAKSASWDLTNSFAGNALTNNGTLDETGRLTLTGNLTGAGTIILGAAPLTLEAGAATAQKIAFSGTAETLALGDPAKFAGTIQHFAPADTIDLTGLAIGNLETMSFAHGKLTLAATTGTYTITFAKPTQFSGETFSAFAGGAGTAITLAAAATAFLPSPTIAAPNFLPITH